MMNWILCGLIVSLCISITVNKFLYLRLADTRRELAEATDWMDPILIEKVGEDDEL